MSLARALAPITAADPDAELPAFLSTELEPLPPSPRALGIPPPSVTDILRQCRPSRELLGLLSRESTKAANAGNLDDATALLALAFCVREVLPR